MQSWCQHKRAGLSHRRLHRSWYIFDMPRGSSLSYWGLSRCYFGILGYFLYWLLICQSLCHQENLDASEIRMQHLKNALRQVQPSDIQSYKELSAKFQRLVHSNAREDLSRHHQRSSKSSWFPIWWNTYPASSFTFSLIFCNYIYLWCWYVNGN